MYKTFSSEAIIIKKVPYLEKDIWVTFFSKEEGKFTVLMKGARDTNNKSHGKIELFSLVEILIEKRNSYIIKNIKVLKYFEKLSGNIHKFTIANHIVELSNMLMPIEYKNLNIFELLNESLKSLETEDKNLLIYLIYEIKALFMLGYCRRIQNICSKCCDIFKEDFCIDMMSKDLLCNNCSLKFNKNIIKIDINALKIFNFFVTENIATCKKLNIIDKKIIEDVYKMIINLHFLPYEGETKSSKILSLLK